MAGKTKFLPVVAMACGLGLVLWYQSDKLRGPTATTETMAPTFVPGQTRSTENPTPALRKIGPADVIDVNEWIKHGPKEPLVPPEIHINGELAPGSVVTAEPLVPPEIRINAQLAPGSSATKNPLTPPEIHVDAPPR